MRREGGVASYCEFGGRRSADNTCYLCIANAKGRETNKGHYLYRNGLSKKKVYRCFMKRPDNLPTGKPCRLDCTDATWAKRFPLLVELMVDGAWEDGKARELCSIKITFSTGSANVALADPNFKRSVYTAAETVEKALKLLEDALSDQSVGWRPWKSGK